MNDKQRAILIDVVNTIEASGYACKPEPKRTRRGHVQRKEQIEVLAYDRRINSKAHCSEMIDYVMATYRVNRNVAKIMISRARKVAQAQSKGE